MRIPSHSDSAPVRPGEELNRTALSRWLGKKIDGVERGFTVEQFPGGHSNLTYLLPSARGALRYPDMRVRIYHDAHLVEAQEWADAHGQPLLRALRSRAERELDQRWARNMMLNKWLEYCVERGHRFSSRTEREAGA